MAAGSHSIWNSRLASWVQNNVGFNCSGLILEREHHLPPRQITLGSASEPPSKRQYSQMKSQRLEPDPHRWWQGPRHHMASSQSSSINFPNELNRGGLGELKKPTRGREPG